MPWAILDSSVYIDHWERNLYEADLAAVRDAFVIRYSAVVLSELRRGARTGAARRLVEALCRLASTAWTPTAGDWCEAGQLVRTIGDRGHWDDHERRGVQNDALIALTARRHGRRWSPPTAATSSSCRVRLGFTAAGI